MKKRRIVVIYNGDDWDTDYPQMSETTRKSFEDWHERGVANNIEMFRAFFGWYNYDKNFFKKAWAYRNKKWIKVTDPIKPDMIFDKLPGRVDYELFDYKIKISRKVKIFNNPLFRTALDNKLVQYLVLKDFMPESFLALNESDLNRLFNSFAGNEKVVIKPLYGSGGFGIIIDKKANLNPKKIEYPVFVQKFIKSEKGIPGFSQKKEVADLRMVFINHKLVYALSRVAKKGSLFTNFHQGAQAVLVPNNKIPISVKKMSDEIIKKLSLFSQAHYSLDFIFTNEGKPFLVEMNTTPGFDLLYLVGSEDIITDNFNKFISILDS